MINRSATAGFERGSHDETEPQAHFSLTPQDVGLVVQRRLGQKKKIRKKLLPNHEYTRESLIFLNPRT